MGKRRAYSGELWRHHFQVFKDNSISDGMWRKQWTQQTSHSPQKGLLAEMVHADYWELRFGQQSHHSLKEKGVSICPNCLDKQHKFLLNTCFPLGVWDFGTCQAEGPTWPAPSENLGQWVCNKLPWHTTFLPHGVTFNAGGMKCVLCDSTGTALLETCLAFPFADCFLTHSLIDLSYAHDCICWALRVLAHHQTQQQSWVTPAQE